MSATRINAEQFEMPVSRAAANSLMTRFTLGKLRDFRTQMTEQLGKERAGLAALAARIMECVPGDSDRAFGAAMEHAAVRPSPRVRRLVKTLRTLCLYIHAQERQLAPRAAAAALPPPRNAAGTCARQSEFFLNPKPKTERQPQ